jgi:probable addiction module antidote protein
LIQTEFSLIKKLVVNLYPNEYSLKRLQTSKFDIADYLDSNEMIAEYLNAVLEEGNDDEIVTAIGHIAKAIGMTRIAEETGMSRPSLYKALSDGAKPQFSTIMKVLKAIGGQIRINPISAYTKITSFKICF